MKDPAWYEAKFWQQVEKTERCWIWLAGGTGREATRYGVAWNGERQVSAHRWSYEMHFGPLPDDGEVSQSCGNHLCVRPDHLILQSRSGAMRQKVDKRPGTPVRGEQNPTSKLSERDVRIIRHRYAQGDVSQRFLATEFGVSQVVISKVVRGVTWRYVDGPRREPAVSAQSNTGYWGVSYSTNRRGKKYQAWLNAHGKRYSLGFYVTAEAAARAREAKALELLGTTARLNFPEDRDPSGNG